MSYPTNEAKSLAHASRNRNIRWPFFTLRHAKT